MNHPQDEVHRRSLEDPESFWAKHAAKLHWHKTPKSVLTKRTKKLGSGVEYPHWEWFTGGEISTCFNCVDRHVLAGNGDMPAIFYDSPVTKTKRRITYAQLLDEVEVTAGALREEGVKKGDVVLVYSRFPAPTHFTRAIGHLTICSANDTRSFDWYSRYQPTRCNSCCCVWWVCCCFFGSTHRGI